MGRTTERITFLPLDISYQMVSGASGEEPELLLLGKTLDGERVAAQVREFFPYFYVLLDQVAVGSRRSADEENAGSHGKAKRAAKKEEEGEGVDLVIAQLTAAHSDVVSCHQVTNKTIYGYTETTGTFIQVVYRNPRKTGEVKTAVEQTYQRLFHKSGQVFETNIGFVIRFMVDKGIVGMGYVEVEVESKKESESGSKKGSGSGSRGQLATPASEGVGGTHSSIGDIHPERVLQVTASQVSAQNGISKLPPLKILSFDLECVGRAGKFPSAQIDPVVQIGNTVVRHPSAEPKQRVLFCLRETSPISGVEVRSFETEAEMLMGWSRWISEADPDVLTGYNVCRFDFAYLLERAEALNLKEFRNFSRTSDPVTIRSVTSTTAAFGTVENKIVHIAGRVVFDVLDIVRREFKLSNYSLNTVSSTFLNEEKEDVHYTEIASLFNGTPDTRKRLGSYCMKDTYLPLRILFTKNLLVNYAELARVTGVPFEYLVTRGQGIRVLSQLLRQAKSHGYFLPLTVGEGEESYEGGYVMEPEKGFYREPVTVLDFASLYPSIIMAYNLCYTTLLTPAQVNQLKPEEYVESPSGDCFVTAAVRPGLLPQILTNLLASRKQARKELASETDPELKMSLDARQLALKISANSVYGFTGAAKTGLPCIPISRSVTSFGREILKKTKELIEEQYRPTQEYVLRVVYGDTDSVMVTAPGVSLEASFQIGAKISEFVTQKLPDPLTLAFEKVYHPFLLMNKKRYAGYSRGSLSAPGKIDIKGIEIVRRDNCQLVRDLMNECLQRIFIDNNVERAQEAIRKTVHDLMSHKIGISKLVITKSIAKKEEAYSVQLAHTELAERMKARDPGTAPGVGDRVSYVIVQGKGPLHQRSEDPVYVLNHNIPIDTVYYLNNQLTKPIQRLMEHIDPDVDKLLAPPAVLQSSMGRPGSFSAKGIGAFLKKKETCHICKLGSHPICGACEPKYPQILRETLERLSLLQYKYHLLMGECQRMQHSTHTPILCASRDCHVFYTRKELTKELTAVQEEYQKLQQFKK